MNVLFTDIDGVLNRGGNFRGGNFSPGSLVPELVYRLVQIAANADRVVIISMWRLFHGVDKISSYFKEHGYSGPDLELLDAEDRAQGIRDWVESNAPTRWVVLDDFLLQGMDEHQVFVTSTNGLNDANVRAALSILDS